MDLEMGRLPRSEHVGPNNKTEAVELELDKRCKDGNRD